MQRDSTKCSTTTLNEVAMGQCLHCVETSEEHWRLPQRHPCAESLAHLWMPAGRSRSTRRRGRAQSGAAEPFRGRDRCRVLRRTNVAKQQGGMAWIASGLTATTRRAPDEGGRWRRLVELDDVRVVALLGKRVSPGPTDQCAQVCDQTSGPMIPPARGPTPTLARPPRLLQQRYLADRCPREALLLILDADLLEGVELPVVSALRLSTRTCRQRANIPTSMPRSVCPTRRQTGCTQPAARLDAYVAARQMRASSLTAVVARLPVCLAACLPAHCDCLPARRTGKSLRICPQVADLVDLPIGALAELVKDLVAAAEKPATLFLLSEMPLLLIHLRGTRTCGRGLMSGESWAVQVC